MADEPKHGAVVEVRISQMVDLMLSNKWRTGVTVRALAEEWGISNQRARELSAEASKVVRREHMANISSDIVPALTDIVRDGGGDVGVGFKIAAVQAAKVLADIAGLTTHEKEGPREQEHGPPQITVTYHSSVKPTVPSSD